MKQDNKDNKDNSSRTNNRCVVNFIFILSVAIMRHNLMLHSSEITLNDENASKSYAYQNKKGHSNFIPTCRQRNVLAGMKTDGVSWMVRACLLKQGKRQNDKQSHQKHERMPINSFAFTLKRIWRRSWKIQNEEVDQYRTSRAWRYPPQIHQHSDNKI